MKETCEIYLEKRSDLCLWVSFLRDRVNARLFMRVVVIAGVQKDI